MFEWDDENTEKLRGRHGIRPEQAEQAVLDPDNVSTDAYDAEEEHREGVIGMSADYRLLVVVYTERNDRLRVLSARDATRREAERYQRR